MEAQRLQRSIEHGPELDYAFSAFKQRGGYNSEILHFHHGDGRKEIVKGIGAKKGGFTFVEAEEMASDLINYQRELAGLGVPIPPIDDIILEYDPRNKRVRRIVATSLWAGEDVEKIIEAFPKDQNPYPLYMLVREMSRILVRMFRRSISKWEVETGMDPKPSNFTRDEDNKIWFVDPFPPRYRKNNLALVEWPTPKTELGYKLGYFKYFDLRGIILGQIAQLSRIRPKLRSFFEEIVLEELGKVVSEEQFLEFLAKLTQTPWRKIRRIVRQKVSPNLLSFEAAEKMILGCLEEKIFGYDYSVYTLREIALEFAAEGVISLEELERFFKESHFEDELSREVLAALQSKLCDFLERTLTR